MVYVCERSVEGFFFFFAARPPRAPAAPWLSLCSSVAMCCAHVAISSVNQPLCAAASLRAVTVSPLVANTDLLHLATCRGMKRHRGGQRTGCALKLAFRRGTTGQSPHRNTPVGHEGSTGSDGCSGEQLLKLEMKHSTTASQRQGEALHLVQCDSVQDADRKLNALPVLCWKDDYVQLYLGVMSVENQLKGKELCIVITSVYLYPCFFPSFLFFLFSLDTNWRVCWQ